MHTVIFMCACAECTNETQTNRKRKKGEIEQKYELQTQHLHICRRCFEWVDNISIIVWNERLTVIASESFI